MSRRPAAELVSDLAVALLGVPLPLGLRCWDGSTAPGPAGSPTLIVRSPRALRRIVYAADELGLARAYVSGDLDVEGDLYAVLQFPDAMAERPRLELGRRALRPLLTDLVRSGVLGLPVRPPAEEARLRGLRHSLRRDKAAISHHYDVGNDFYALLLGPSMVYSCAYCETPSTTLEDAQADKLDLVCRKLGLHAPGCACSTSAAGGARLVLHAAPRLRRACRRRHPLRRAGGASPAADRATAGLEDAVEIRVQDYRDVADGPYDAIASIGMAEHVGARPPAGLRRAPALACWHPAAGCSTTPISRGPAAARTTGAHGRSSTATSSPTASCSRCRTRSDAARAGRFRGARRPVPARALRPHPAGPGSANLEGHWDEAVRLVQRARARVWRLYMAGSALAFERRRIGVNQVLATKAGGASAADDLPLRRPDWNPPPAEGR